MQQMNQAAPTWREQTELLQDIERIRYRRSAVETEIEGLESDRAETLQAIRGGNKASRARLEAIERALILAREKLAEEEAREERAKSQIDPPRMDAAKEARTRLVAQIREKLAQIPIDAAPLDAYPPLLMQAIERTEASIRTVLELASQLLGTARTSCDPDPRQMPTAVLGALLRSCSKPDSYFAPDHHSMDNVRNCEPPSKVVARQCEAILSQIVTRLPIEEQS